MTYKVFVDGQEGTTGLQINEYLAQRSDVTVLKIDADKRKDLAERKRLINESDVTFLCLPDDAAKESVSLVDNPNTCVIAHRINPAWTFGLPELAPDQRAKIRASKRIANPGCHASAFILALRPLIAAGLLPAATQIAANSITGYSGGGKSMIAEYQKASESPTQLKAPRAYGLTLAHKHLPEMQAYTGLTVAPIFQPIVGPFYKGLAVTAYIHPKQFTRPTCRRSSPTTTPANPSSASCRSISKRRLTVVSSTSKPTTTPTASISPSSATMSACCSSPASTTSARAPRVRPYRP